MHRRGERRGQVPTCSTPSSSSAPWRTRRWSTPASPSGARLEGGRAGDLRSIFNRVGEEYANRMSFEVEMIVPPEGEDDLGQRAKATITFLNYRLTLPTSRNTRTRTSAGSRSSRRRSPHITLGDAPKKLSFPHSTEWRKSAGSRSAVGHRIHLDRRGQRHRNPLASGRRGESGVAPCRARRVGFPGTVLSAANAADSQTVAPGEAGRCSRGGCSSSKPSSLREPDDYNSPVRIGNDGSHLPATLARLARQNGGTGLKSMNPVYSRGREPAGRPHPRRALHVRRSGRQARAVHPARRGARTGTHHKAPRAVPTARCASSPWR